jgi:coronin-1B/1C/6
LEAENARLESELREAREKIRNLELQVETIHANAQKAAQTLLKNVIWLVVWRCQEL